MKHFEITKPDGSKMVWRGGPLLPIAGTDSVWLTSDRGAECYHVPKAAVREISKPEADNMEAMLELQSTRPPYVEPETAVQRVETANETKSEAPNIPHPYHSRNRR